MGFELEDMMPLAMVKLAENKAYCLTLLDVIATTPELKQEFKLKLIKNLAITIREVYNHFGLPEENFEQILKAVQEKTNFSF